ncbi:B-type flagellin [Sporomusa carbonis]|uniref:flagellin N-terminal helical domain-containing protein n=1 Tax=Sporomusa carbonis TaxID=3076075 RepID=UPI003A62166D
MSMVINTNLSALNTYNQLNKNNALMNSSLEKLSSGYRINSAADDAAGLAISEKMRGQIRGLNQASSNAQDAISLTQTAEGALDETTSILQRMRELAVQASSDTLTEDDRTAIQDEVNQLRQEIDRIADDTEFNTKKLLNGELSKTATASGTNAASIDSAVAGTNTKAGVYDVTFTTAATQATVGSQANATANSTGTLTTATDVSSFAGDIQINGTTITIESGDTVDDVVKKINNVSGDTGVTATLDSTDATNNFIQLTSDSYGSNATISLSGATATLQDLFAATTGTETTVSDAGTDAVGTINGQTATGKGNTLTLNKSGDAADGLTVVGKDGTVADGDTATITVGTDNALYFQIGANEGQGIELAINNMDAYSLGVATSDGTDTGLDLSTSSKATAAITTIDSAINKVSSERAKLGAVENRLEHTINNLTTSSENLTAAESRIRDVDMASEMATYTKLSVLNQAATAMLAQANQLPQQVLSLLK